MGKKLYVGNLPFAATEPQIQELFAQVGNVESVKIIYDRASGRSKGFGFVEFAADEHAQQALEKFNGTEFNGRTLKVSEATEKPREATGTESVNTRRDHAPDLKPKRPKPPSGGTQGW